MTSALPVAQLLSPTLPLGAHRTAWLLHIEQWQKTASTCHAASPDPLPGHMAPACRRERLGKREKDGTLPPLQPETEAGWRGHGSPVAAGKTSLAGQAELRPLLLSSGHLGRTRAGKAQMCCSLVWLWRGSGILVAQANARGAGERENHRARVWLRHALGPACLSLGVEPQDSPSLCLVCDRKGRALLQKAASASLQPPAVLAQADRGPCVCSVPLQTCPT